MQSKLPITPYLRTAIVAWLVIVIAAPMFSHLIIPASMATYNINVAPDSLSVTVAGDFLQGIRNPFVNATGIFALLPNFKGTLVGGNSSQLETALTRSIREKSPGALVSQARLLVESNGNTNQTRVSYDLTFTIQNVTGSSGNVCCKVVDLSWRAFVIQDDFAINQFSINKILPNYLQTNIATQAQAPANPPNTGIQTVRTWYVNSLQTVSSRIPSITRNQALFNFSSLTRPLTAWSIQTDFPHSKVTLSSSTGFNLTLVQRFIEADETSSLAVNAVNNLNVTIQAPLGAKIGTNDLILETSTLVPEAMSAIFTIIIIVLVVSYLVERRIQHQAPSRKLRKS